MIIVSQNKLEIINFNRVTSVWVETEVNGSSIQADGEYLGNYESEERAKEVLQEIIEELKASYGCYLKPFEYINEGKKVYEMPEN